MHKPLAKCPPGDASFKVALCTEGSSLVPLMKAPDTAIKTAAFSQYPRGYQHTAPNGRSIAGSRTQSDSNVFGSFAEEDWNEAVGSSSTPTVSTCIVDVYPTGKPAPGCTMGYTLVTTVDGHEYRYTEVRPTDS